MHLESDEPHLNAQGVYMRFYNTQTAVVAVKLIIAKANADLLWDQKNAAYIESSFRMMLEKKRVRRHMQLCMGSLEAFSKDVADLAYGADVLSIPSRMPNEHFMKMSYIFMCYLEYFDGQILNITEATVEKSAKYAHYTGLGQREILLFFRGLSEDIWDICLGEEDAEEHALLIAV